MSKLNVCNKNNSKISDYFRQYANLTKFSSSESWVILSSIEKQIKETLENRKIDKEILLEIAKNSWSSKIKVLYENIK